VWVHARRPRCYGAFFSFITVFCLLGHQRQPIHLRSKSQWVLYRDLLQTGSSFILSLWLFLTVMIDMFRKRGSLRLGEDSLQTAIRVCSTSFHIVQETNINPLISHMPHWVLLLASRLSWVSANGYEFRPLYIRLRRWLQRLLYIQNITWTLCKVSKACYAQTWLRRIYHLDCRYLNETIINPFLTTAIENKTVQLLWTCLEEPYKQHLWSVRWPTGQNDHW
jgi:hypothetical protein